MTDDSLFIEDGYSATKVIEGVPGLYPELRVTYRPALSRERTAYRAKLAGADVETVERHEIDLIVRHKVSVNGTEMKEKEKLAKLRPAIRAHLLDLILGYTPADEAADAGN